MRDLGSSICDIYHSACRLGIVTEQPRTCHTGDATVPSADIDQRH